MTSSLTLAAQRDAVARAGAAALTRRVSLQPAGGLGNKVFPPTYAGGQYAAEQRRIDGAEVACVLLDSVQSQANRMEAPLQAACDAGRLQLPQIVVDFSG